MPKSPQSDTLQTIVDRAHIPAVAYSCVTPKAESDGASTQTSVTLGKKSLSPDNRDNSVNSVTLFPASSLSKVVFTYLVLQLVKEGEEFKKDILAMISKAGHTTHLEYDIELMSSLPDLSQAENGKVYLSEKPRAYYVKGMSEPASIPLEVDLTRLATLFDLDHPLSSILPYEKFLVDGQYPEKAQKVTARHVLSHTTGLPNFGPKPATTLKFSDVSELGKGYSYSGEAFLYLQRVLEKYTGKDLETLAKEYVFERLGMERSTFLPPPEGEENIVAVHTELEEPEPVYIGDPPDNAAGSLLTTADDFSKFIAACMEDPFIQQAFVPRSSDDFPTCGLGWHLYKDGDDLIAYQYGCNPNTRSFVAINLNTQRGAAFFTNAEHGMSIANQVLSSPNLAPIGDLRVVLKDLGYSQVDEPGWLETFEGKIAEKQDDFKKAKFYFSKALSASNNDVPMQRRIKWFNAVHKPSLKTQVFTLSDESFEGTFTNQYKDNIEISMTEGGLVYKEFDNEIKLVRVSETEFLPEKDQSFKITIDGEEMRIDYLLGDRPKVLSKSSPEAQEESAMDEPAAFNDEEAQQGTVLVSSRKDEGSDAVISPVSTSNHPMREKLAELRDQENQERLDSSTTEDEEAGHWFKSGKPSD